MNASSDRREKVALVRLTREGVVRVAGADARAFLHGQLTNDIQSLAQDRVRRAGWCTAKGRLLATVLVLRDAEDFLLLLPTELVAGIVKRLRMFVLRSKVTVDDECARWAHYGLIGDGVDGVLAASKIEFPDAALHAVARAEHSWFMRLEGGRVRVLVASDSASMEIDRLGLHGVDEARWTLEDIRAGVPQVVAATQELFVPQMVNFEAVGGLDFKKGCYPGQEVVARAQYRGQVKRQMRRARVADGTTPAAGQDLYCDDSPGQICGTVVASAAADGASELLAVVPIAADDTQGTTVRVSPGGAALEWLPLPYAA
jgi:folate-binding protein YgfZ